MDRYLDALAILGKKKRQNIEITDDDISYLHELYYIHANNSVRNLLIINLIFMISFFVCALCIKQLSVVFLTLFLLCCLIFLIQVICVIKNKKKYNTSYNLRRCEREFEKLTNFIYYGHF